MIWHSKFVSEDKMETLILFLEFVKETENKEKYI